METDISINGINAIVWVIHYYVTYRLSKYFWKKEGMWGVGSFILSVLAAVSPGGILVALFFIAMTTDWKLPKWLE